MGVVTETLEITHSTLKCPFQLSIFVSKLLYSLKLSVFLCVCEKSIPVSSSQHCYNDEREGMYGKHLGNGSPTHKVAAAASTTDNMNLNSNGFPPDQSSRILNCSRTEQILVQIHILQSFLLQEYVNSPMAEGTRTIQSEVAPNTVKPTAAVYAFYLRERC